jgi:tRNA(adenine34) deaminase
MDDQVFPGPEPSHAAFMDLALREARLALSEEEVPVGAALVTEEGEVLAADHNRRERSRDPTAHAEMLVLRRGAALVGDWRLSSCTLYVTLEPCPMCAGAAVLSRIKRIVFGAADPKAGACGSLYNLCSDPRLNHEIEVTPGVLAEESAQLLRAFFARRRGGPSR